MKYVILFFCMTVYCGIVNAQTYTIDARIPQNEIFTGHLKMGNPGSVGKEIIANNRYVTIGGKPVLPVMGEMQYARIPREQWEDVILKMKACGVNIIETYIFWIHHEEIEGQFDWSGNKDLRSFLLLCKKHDMYVMARIGPWCHGEARNGGTPDWIRLKKNLEDRTNDPVYQVYVDRWFSQIAAQTQGLLYKNGGPIIGVQLENEYSYGKSGEPHIQWLKATAIKYGLDVPLYTVTGWNNASVPACEVIPLWGAYPDAPWDSNIERTTTCNDFQFSVIRNNEKIGNDLKKGNEPYIDLNKYPYLTCEMGVGIENTEHRRLIISPIDGLALVTAKLGSGSNLIGYYTFAGASNPQGILSSMEENREEVGYANTNPQISYDFQAAIKESGELAPSYFEIKKFNYFLNDFGERLAPMEPVIAPQSNDLQLAVRVKDHAGFLFGINYCRSNPRPELKGIRFKINLKDETLVFPQKAITIPDGSLFIWPFNFEMNGTLLKYATAQPLCTLNQNGKAVWVFAQDTKVQPEFCFDATGIRKIESENGSVEKQNGNYLISGLRSGVDCFFTVITDSGEMQKVLVLSQEDAKHAWLFKNNGQKQLFVSNSNMYADGKKVYVFGTSPDMKFKMLGTGDKRLSVNGRFLQGKAGKLFTEYTYSLPVKNIPFELTKKKVLDDAQWLKTSVVSVNKDNLLYHRFFIKEFSLGNPSRIKSARIILASESPVKIQINNNWVGQSITPDKVNLLDITGYVRSGENTLMLDFPYEQGDKAFAARVIVDYYNTESVEFFSNSSWLTRDSYAYPSYLQKDNSYVAPEIAKQRETLNRFIPDFSEYTLKLPVDYSDGLNNTCLKLSYIGDKARCRINHQLVADDFNNNTLWSIGLNRLVNQTGVQNLRFELLPLNPGYKIYFDNPPLSDEIGRAELKTLKIIPEYKIAVEF